MPQLLAHIINRIADKNKLHAKKLASNMGRLDQEFYSLTETFLEKYKDILASDGKTIDYAVDCYLQMLADINYESVQFLRTGEYSSKSFRDVNDRVYNNPDVMEYYMHGLLLSQFLWTYHYNILQFFKKTIEKNSGEINNYLEVGGGHGLYISEAKSMLGEKTAFDLVDISQSSLEMARKMVDNGNISFIQADISGYAPGSKYDFITMGEVMEHVEDPLSLLKKLNLILKDDGKLFITTPTNAPAIDHIYLFRNAGEIRNIIASAGFKPEQELCTYAEDLPAEKAEQLKITMMYAAVLVKQNSQPLPPDENFFEKKITSN